MPALPLHLCDCAILLFPQQLPFRMGRGANLFSSLTADYIWLFCIHSIPYLDLTVCGPKCSSLVFIISMLLSVSAFSILTDSRIIRLIGSLSILSLFIMNSTSLLPSWQACACLYIKPPFWRSYSSFSWLNLE